MSVCFVFPVIPRVINKGEKRNARSLILLRKQTRQAIKIYRCSFWDKGIKSSAKCLSRSIPTAQRLNTTTHVLLQNNCYIYKPFYLFSFNKYGLVIFIYRAFRKNIVCQGIYFSVYCSLIYTINKKTKTVLEMTNAFWGPKYTDFPCKTVRGLVTNMMVACLLVTCNWLSSRRVSNFESFLIYCPRFTSLPCTFTMASDSELRESLATTESMETEDSEEEWGVIETEMTPYEDEPASWCRRWRVKPLRRSRHQWSHSGRFGAEIRRNCERGFLVGSVLWSWRNCLSQTRTDNDL